MLEALKAHKLKKAAATRVADPLKSVASGVDTDVWNSANIELWYEPIKNYTFKTEFLPLPVPTAKAIVRACGLFFADKEVTRGEEEKQRLSDEETKLLQELAQQIDGFITALSQGREKAAFVKLSCRSPKDATVASGKTHRLYESIIERLKQEGRDIDDNAKVTALYEAHLVALKVGSGEEAVSLFTQSCRIQEDLELSLKDETKFDIEVVVREWMDIPISNEFRGFVVNKQLNGLSQYFDMCYFQGLHDGKGAIVCKIQEFFDTIKDDIPLASYILDFCITRAGQVYIIELNPFSRTTDAALFNWDHDAEVLNSGPFQFRLRETPIRQAKHEVLVPWKRYFD